MQRRSWFYIILISVVYRLLFLLGNWRNTFIDSWVPYPLQPDAYYYYLLPLPKEIIFLIPLICLSIGLIFFYEICKKFFNNKTSFIATICLSLLYPFFIQTYASYTDTPSIIFMFMMIVVYFMLNIFENKKLETRNVSLIILTIIILRSLWDGWILIPIVLAISLFPIFWERYENKSWKITLIVLSVLTLIFALPKTIVTFIEFLGLFNVISELRPNWNPIWLVLNVLIFIILFDLFRREDDCLVLRLPVKKYFIFALSIIFTILSMVMRRWTYLAMPFVIIVIFLWLGKMSKKALYVLMSVLVILSIVNTTITFTRISPLMNQDTQYILESLENRTILCNWANGHVYNLFTIGEVKNKGHPKEFHQWIYGLKNDSRIFDNMTKNDYYIIFNDWDLKKLNNSMEYDMIVNSSIITVYERR